MPMMEELKNKVLGMCQQYGIQDKDTDVAAMAKDDASWLKILSALKDNIATLDGATDARGVRHVFDEIQQVAFERLGAPCEKFKGSTYYHYIQEMKTKQGVVPSIHDFKLIKVLGQGGFGKVFGVSAVALLLTVYCIVVLDRVTDEREVAPFG